MRAGEQETPVTLAVSGDVAANPMWRRLLPAIACGLAACVQPAFGHDGDVNVDGAVDTADLLWGMQAVEGSRGLLPEQLLHGDVAPLVSGVPAPDGVFSPGDLVVLLRMLHDDLRLGIPGNQFNIGDSIGVGEAANNTVGQPHHETVWSTGFNGDDVVNSLNERFESGAPAAYHENNADRDATFNHAVSGSVMAGFASQAQAVVDAARTTPSGEAGMVTVFLGSNDVCAPSL